MALSSRPSMALLRQLRRVRPSTLPRAAAAGAASPPAATCARRLQSTTESSSSSSQPESPSSFSSVNASEVSHFNALASSWWDPHGPSRPLHLMNPLRHDFIRTCRASQADYAPDDAFSPRRLRYLDVGCGGGIFAESAARLPSTASVTAVDPSPEVLAVARAHAARDPALVLPAGEDGLPRLRYVAGTVETLPAPASAEELYDVVSLFEVVEHVDSPAAFLERCGALVRPGGWLVLSTIARTWTSWLVTNVVAEDILGAVPRGTHDWRKYINEEEMRAFFARGKGWGEPLVMGVVYVPGLGWKEVPGSEKIGNYFFGVRKEA
ncbi:hypothetical protein NKR23_g7314 [Pleurostoma richardsiae]|uniref:Ubiquinone biosynthesis O-methyltransferase, mitochondrial n=1 Tax=Pleurostoma richardsiae TaxID=41990 RepID=A0AA38RBY5_9PEZI|nr:hypothetical protein NKR23_g7314 [Pleurostoma richardsiae]